MLQLALSLNGLKNRRMDTEALLAVTNGQLQADDFALLGVVVVAIAVIAGFMSKLTRELRRTKKELQDQAKLNARLNETVERVLRLDDEDSIHSHRRATSRQRQR
jgi:hypothetical protein